MAKNEASVATEKGLIYNFLSSISRTIHASIIDATENFSRIRTGVQVPVTSELQNSQRLRVPSLGPSWGNYSS